MNDETKPTKADAHLVIDPGSASAEEIAEFLAELSKLYRMMGGSGIKFKAVNQERTDVK